MKIFLLALIIALAGCSDDSGGTHAGPQDAGSDAQGDAGDAAAEDSGTPRECDFGQERCDGTGRHWVCYGGEWVEEACPAPTVCTTLDPKCKCPAGSNTRISGTVLAPNGLDPVSRAFVFLPSDPTAIPKEAPGAHCIQCLDPILVKKSTTADAEGNFTLEGFAEGMEQTVVVRKGPFQRTYTLTADQIQQCQDNVIPSDAIRLPADPTEAGENGRFPAIAVSTGMFDRMQDVIAKAGLNLDHVDIFHGGGDPAAANRGNASEELFAGFDATTGEDNIMKYDIVFINCGQSGGSWDTIADTRKALLQRYVNRGGRLYITDMAYDFIEQPFPDKVAFLGDSSSSPGAIDAAETGNETASVTGEVLDANLLEWLTTNFPHQISGTSVETVGWLQNWVVVDNFTPSPPATTPEDYRDKDLWVQGEVTYSGNITQTKPLTLSFNVDPEGTADLDAAHRLSCGRVLFSSYHTFKEEGTAADGGTTEISVQERILEYLILEIGVTFCESIPIG